ncbi:small-conductance mechanosensitive channel [Litoreibacter ponti]|uniref:Small-conductance mechanosensitive channel n=1 Tax=Litoreibacter ponti TaxID=1510457 RepID=A0A2T6BJD2_9RHOB|nr:mechanosensitive ion channel domain-containing protein [Litoreibacter ponti]PTX56169.1 small-conductance mechanosensitive channel [Litoreibacter ponti]
MSSYSFKTRLLACLLAFFVALTGAPSAAQDQAAEGADGALSTLLDVLKDDAAREKLIAELEASVAPAAEAVAETATATAQEQVSLGRRIAVFTQEAVEGTVERATALWSGLTSGENALSGLRGDEFGIVLSALPSLLLVIVITVGIYIGLRLLARPFYRRMGNRAHEANSFSTALLFVGTNLVDAVIVVLAWAAGYAITVLALGEFGNIGIRQTMYLNAFLIVEMVKVAIRVVLSPSASGLRIVPLSDSAAQSLYRTAKIVVSVLGYGQLLVVPIVNQSASFAAGSGITALLAVGVLIYLMTVVWARRKPVAAWIVAMFDPHAPVQTDQPGPAEQATAEAAAEIEAPARPGGLRGMLMSLALIWHWFALVYLTAIFIVVMTQPAETTFAVLIASGKVLATLVAASLVSGMLARSIATGISLPEDVTMKLPLLEPRLNGFMTRALGAVRLVIMAIAVFFILDIISVLDVRGWLGTQFGQELAGTLVTLGLILVVAFALWLAMTSWVDFRLNPEYGAVPTARETTLLSLLRNALTIVLVVLTLMFCLSEIGLDIGPLLASAGVLGLAIGFGAQKMVQDIITGVFIQFENAINVGDVITVGGTTGGVEKLSVRSVSLRDVHGVFHIIPFSSVDMVSNFSRDFSFAVCDMGVAYRENVDEVREVMHACFDELREHPDQGGFILGDLEWFGVQSFGDSAVVLRCRIKTLPGKQWGVGRAYNEILKRQFDAAGIEIPFPHQTIFFGESKDGKTQPLKVVSDET